MDVAQEQAAEVPLRRRLGWRKYTIAALLGLLGLIAIAVAVLNSPIGHRFVVDRIARFAPASGLRVEIGRIDGSLYGAARLHDVTLADPQGVFARIPLVELDWRPISWFSSGIDVRSLVTRRGVLLRRPMLKPGAPDAPLLPDFDIRIDRFEIDDLTIGEGVARTPRKVDLVAKVDIRKGRALIRADGRLGGQDRLQALVDADPGRDRFDLALDLAAPKGGVLAGLTGTEGDLAARLVGKGTWTKWDGAFLARQSGQDLAALTFTNRAGRYRLLGLAWPDGLLTGLARRAAGRELAVDAESTFEGRRLDGRFALLGEGLAAEARGGLDLAANAFEAMQVNLRTRRPDLLGGAIALDDARISARLDGQFRALSAEHVLTARALALGPATRLEGLTQRGTATYDGTTWTLPLALGAARVVTGSPQFDKRLAPARATGTIRLVGARLWSDDLALVVPGLAARLALSGDTAKGGYGVAGPVAARGLALPNLGLANADARIVASFGNAPWKLRGNLSGRFARVDNATLTALAGSGIRFGGQFALAQNQPILIDRATVVGSKLSLGLAGRRLADGRTILKGRGKHSDYGPFSLDANLSSSGPRAVLVFADPLPVAGLKDVRVALSPIPQGFRLETAGGSTLGPFTGVLGLYAAPGRPTRLEVERLEVWKTAVTGTLLLERGGANGTLALAGGGVQGTVRLAPRGGGQGFDLALTARDAQFGGDKPLSLASATIAANGVLLEGRTTLAFDATGEGLSQGNLFVGRFAANGRMTAGRGQFNASLAGRRGSRFALQLAGEIAPERIAVLAGGDFAGRRITMPRRAVFTAETGGWRLAPAQVDFGGGRAIASGLLGSGGTELSLALVNVPLSLGDIAWTDLGLGGTASGLVEYRAPRGGLQSGSAQLQIRQFTRSGLLLTSRPADLAIAARLDPGQLELRAVMRDNGQVRGRVQGRISGLPRSGKLEDRLQAGALFAQLRFDGPADALWRLIALEAFDLTGQVALAADATGSLARPLLRGSLASDGLRLRSGLIGADISGIAVRGRFAGSRLDLTTLSGKTANGGTVSGSGFVDLAGLGKRSPAFDLRLAAHSAAILSRDDMAATVTGPLRIVSDGVQGTIAGRLAIERARWQLGRAAAVQALPSIRTREINRPGDIAPPRALAAPWKFLIDASGPQQIAVRGLGIDSEWGADIRIRGTTAAPTLAGQANLVRGGYEFAGKRFEMTRGRIHFDGGSPPNPRLDIAAEAQVTGLNARVTVTGTSLQPVIAFSSVPAMPEEELLARLLFGDSIANISAPEALQLGAALSGLRGGGGLDPLNKLRGAIGLDRLRIVGADATFGRGTGVAVGKNFGRRLYAEIITDGRGYSATQLEYRVTSWLAILASVSTIGRESINVRVSKDY